MKVSNSKKRVFTSNVSLFNEETKKIEYFNKYNDSEIGFDVFFQTFICENVKKIKLMKGI